MEFRFWNKKDARTRYNALLARGVRCNMSHDGRGVIVIPITDKRRKDS